MIYLAIELHRSCMNELKAKIIIQIQLLFIEESQGDILEARAATNQIE